MLKKAVPWFRVLFVITALLISQVQAAASAGVSPEPTGSSGGAPSNSEVTSARLLPGMSRDDCKIYINTFLLAAPFAGPPVAGTLNYGATVSNTTTSPYVEKKAGDVTEWLVVIENSTDADGCDLTGAEELTQAAAELQFFDGATAIATLPVTLNTTTLTNDGDLAWGTVSFTIPNNLTSSTLLVTTTAATEAVNNPAAGVAPNDVVDFDLDRVAIVGPGFSIVSFTPSVDQAGPGELVDFTLVIQNTRPGVTITGVSIASDYAPFAAYCTNYPSFSGSWTPVGGGTPIANLAPATQAQCVITGVPIPSSPPPDSYALTADVTVTNGDSSLDVTQHTVSDAVDVKLPSVAVAKTITSIRRGSTQIYPADPPPPATAGDVITYGITVTNNGDVTLQDLWIVDSLTGPVFLSPGQTLDPGAQFALTATHVVQQDSPDPLVNMVTVTARGVGFSETITANASASYDILDSALSVNLTVVDPVSGDPVFVVNPGDVVRYRLALRNEGSTVISNLTYITLALPLRTVGTPPSIVPDSLPVPSGPGDQLVLTWDYTIQPADLDPLVSTVRVRGTGVGGMLIYGQSQASLDISNPAIGVEALITEPDTDTVLRGATVVYQVTATNKGGSPICNVKVKQIRRDPDTGRETVLMAELPFNFPSGTGQLAAGESVVTNVSYLVTSEDKDPLDMIFEMTATDACPTGSVLTDRTTRVLDVSDAQVNADLVADVGVDGIVQIGEAIVFTFVAENVGAVTLDNLTATYCIYHGSSPTSTCNLAFDPDKQLAPTAIGSFDETTGGFTYTILAADAEAVPFVAEVTMLGTDNKGKVVSIKAATTVTIATDKVLFELSGPESAVIGDLITFNYTVTNNSGVDLTEVRIYNLLEQDALDPTGFLQVDVCDDIPPTGVNSCTGSFDYRIKPNQGISGDVLTMVARVMAGSAGGPLMSNATATVNLIPILLVEKVGDATAVAGETVHYTITITNQSASQNVNITQYDDAIFDQYSIAHGDAEFAPWPNDPDTGTATPGILPWGTSVSGNFTIPDPPGVDPLPDPLVNTFTVTGTREYDGANVSAFGTHTLDIACPIAFNWVVTNLEPPGDADDVLGEMLRWQISLTNVSGGPIDNITVTEQLHWLGAGVPNAEITWPGSPGHLNSGQSATLNSFDIQITSNYYTYAEFDTINDVVLASFSAVAGVSSCGEAHDYFIYSPIGVAKLPDPLIAFTGETVDYALFVYNVTEADDGIYSRYYVTTTDTLLEPKPMPMPYEGADAVSGWIEPEQIVQKVVSREVLPDDPDELVNTITAEFPDPANPDFRLFTWATATVITSNPLQVTKTPSASTAVAGTRITYDYTITNTSPYSITDITMVDTLIGDLLPGGTINLDPGMSNTDLVDVPYDIKLNDPDPLVNTVTATGKIHLPDGSIRDLTTAVTAQVDLQDTDIELVKSARLDDGTGNPDGPLQDLFPASKPDGVPEVASGTKIHYCFSITNTNPGTSTYVDDIVVQDALFPGFLQAPFQDAVIDKYDHDAEPARLYGGESVEFCYGPVAVSQAMGDPLNNLVYLNGTSSSGIPLYSEDEYEIDIRGTDILITKLPSQPLAYVGENLIYTIMIQNTNASLPIQITEVTDTFEGGAPFPLPLDQFDWLESAYPGTPVGILGAGGHATLDLPYTVRNTDPDPLRNVATVTGKLDESPLPESEWKAVEDSTSATVAITATQLLVRKTAAPIISNPSENQCGTTGHPDCRTVHYTITITNVGSTNVKGIIAVDHHWDTMTGDYVDVLYDSVGPGGLTKNELAPSQSAFIVYDLPMPTKEQLSAHPELDPYVNEVTVYGVVFDEYGNPILMPNPDPDDPYDDTMTIKTSVQASVDILQPYVRIVKSPVTLAAAPGQTVTYNIIITGAGDQTLDHLVFTDVTESQSVDLDANCPNVDVAICPFVYGPEPVADYDSNPATADTPNPKEGQPYDETSGLAQNETLRGTITVQVPDDWTGSEFLNVAEITGQTKADATAVQDRSSATIDIRSEGIEVQKLASVSSAPAGSPVTYTIQVTNIGVNSITRLVISDPALDSVPSHVVTIEGGFPDSPEDVIPGDDSATLDADEMFTYSYVHVLAADGPDPYINRVTVAGYTATTSVLNVAEVAVDVQGATVSVEKYVCVGADADSVPETMNDPCPTVVNISDGVPDVVTYYLHIFNPGQIEVDNLTVTDSLATVPPIVWPLAGVNGLAPDDGLIGGQDEIWVMYQYTVQAGVNDPLVNLVTVNGQSPSGSPVTASASASLDLVTSDLMLTKTSVTRAVRGQDVRYQFTLQNLSTSTPIMDIDIVDPISGSGGNPILSCHVDQLDPGASEDCWLTHTISETDAAPLTNTATATGTESGVTVSDVSSHTIEIVTPGLSISKTADRAVAAVGQTVTYTYVVTNTGLDMDQLVVSDSNHPDADFSAPWPSTLAAGATETRTWSHVISAQDPDPYINTMTVTGRVNGQSLQARTSETIMIANGSLAASVVPSQTFAVAGDSITFAYSVTNLDATSTVTNLVLTDSLCGTAVLTPQLGGVTSLAPGASVTVYCTVTAALPGPIVATFTAQGEMFGDALSDTATAEVPVTSGGLVVTKTADSYAVLPGAVIAYTITFTNIGTETLNNIDVTDPVIPLSPAAPDSLAAGQSFTMTGTYLVPTVTPPSSVSNTVTVSGVGATTGETYTDTDSASVAVLEDPSATLALTKEVSAATGRPGDTVTYTLTVRNISPIATVATNITLSDSLLGFTNEPLPDLAAGNTHIITRAITIPTTWIQTTFTNTAQVSVDGALQDTATATVLMELLSFTKTADPDPVALGDELQYTFTVTSYSQGTIPNVTITDDQLTTWDTALDPSVPPGVTTALGHVVIPTDYAGDTFTNAAQLLIGAEVVDTDTVTVAVSRLGLEVEIVSVTQADGAASPQPMQTGEQVTVTLTLHNLGTTPILSPAFTANVNIGNPALTCTPVGTLPASIAAGSSTTTTCIFTPQIGLAEYVSTGLARTVTVDATGTVSGNPVGDQATADITLVDLRLIVDLVVNAPAEAGPDDTVTFTVNLTNGGASPLGCLASADPVGENLDCHLHITLEDSLTGADSNLAALITSLESGIYNTVIAAGASTAFTTGSYTLPDILSADNPVIYTAVADAGYYSASLATNLLTHYIVHGQDTASLTFTLPPEPEITVGISVYPIPPVYGSNVTYTALVTNTGTVTVTNLAATYQFGTPTTGILLMSRDNRPAQQAVTLTLNSTTLIPGQSTTGILFKLEDRTAPYTFTVTVTGSELTSEVVATTTLTPSTTTTATITGTLTATLDPNAVDPIVTKTASVAQAMPGDPVVWTITVRNGGTAIMSNVTVQDSVPDMLVLGTSATTRGTVVTAGQIITVTTGALNPGDTVTITVNTTISSTAAAPATIANSACAARDGGTQKCATGSVTLGPGASTLPSTGIRSSSSGGFPPVGLIFFGALMVLMSAQVSRRRAWIATLSVLISLAIVAGAVLALALSGNDKDKEKPTQVGQAATATPVEAVGETPVPPAVETEATQPQPVSTQGPGELVMQFPPTPTPYVVPTQFDVRYLMIPRLGDQFKVPIPIVELGLVDRQWDVSGLGYYVGWLQGTTWLDPHWGNTVLVAHVQLGFNNPGPFWGLGELEPGDEIIISEGAQERHFKVMSTEKVEPNDVTVTAPTAGPMLTLITCTEWDNNYGVFSQRMVVKAVPSSQS